MPIGEQVQAISGHYSIVKEDCLSSAGREVLYLVGVGTVDSSCCGEGGCSYAVVPGFLVKKHAARNQEGMPVSLVEPIQGDELKKKIASAIREMELVDQVNFL